MATTVTVGGVAATNVAVTSATSLTADVPAGTAGEAVDVVVTTSAGSATATDAFTYEAPVVPMLATTSPDPMPVGVETTVTITGTDLTEVGGSSDGRAYMLQWVDSGGTGMYVSTVMVVSDTEITVPDVNIATAGDYRWVVLATGEPVSNELPFTVGTPLPVLTSVDPAEIRSADPPNQTITGTNLGDVGGSILPGGTTYTLAQHNPDGNTFKVGSVTQISDTQISTNVGTLGALGDYYFVVLDADDNEVSNQLPFTVVSA